MNRLLPLSIAVNTLLLCVFLAVPAQGAYGEGNPRLQRLYSEFIAPCCWRENLTSHQSPAADQLRSRVATMTQDGHTDEEIRGVLVAEFGKRILSLPEGQARTWLFWTPAFLLALGATSLVWFLRRIRQAPVQLAGPMAELEPGWDQE